MGKKIDGFVLTCAAAVAFYLFFRGAFQSRMLALALALLCCALLGKFRRLLFKHFSNSKWVQRRRVRSCASSTLLHLACLPPEEALQRIEALIQKSYSGDYSIVLLQGHPSTQLPQERLFEAWKAHRDSARLVICTTCRCDDASRALAGGLKRPRVALLDGNALMQLIAEHPQGLVPPQAVQQKSRLRFRRAADLLFNRKNAPRCLLLSGAMLAMYLLSANPFQLAGAMALLFVALVALRRPLRPAKLF